MNLFSIGFVSKREDTGCLNKNIRVLVLIVIGRRCSTRVMYVKLISEDTFSLHCFVDSFALLWVLGARNERNISISYMFVFSSYMLICVAQRETKQTMPPTSKGCDGFQHPFTLRRTLTAETND